MAACHLTPVQPLDAQPAIDAAAAATVTIVAEPTSTPRTIGLRISQLPGNHAAPYIYVQDVTIDGESARIPPSSGSHLAQQSVYGFQGDGMIPEAVVHNMEHGAVVLWYQPHDAQLADKVFELVRSLGDECLVAGSYANQSFQITATVWGRALPQATYDEPALLEFIKKFRGTDGPEAGLCGR